MPAHGAVLADAAAVLPGNATAAPTKRKTIRVRGVIQRTAALAAATNAFTDEGRRKRQNKAARTWRMWKALSKMVRQCGCRFALGLWTGIALSVVAYLHFASHFYAQMSKLAGESAGFGYVLLEVAPSADHDPRLIIHRTSATAGFGASAARIVRKAIEENGAPVDVTTALSLESLRFFMSTFYGVSTISSTVRFSDVFCWP
jgi:hypothetical protein